MAEWIEKTRKDMLYSYRAMFFCGIPSENPSPVVNAFSYQDHNGRECGYLCLVNPDGSFRHISLEAVNQYYNREECWTYRQESRELWMAAALQAREAIKNVGKVMP
jgi:hypothetical protein